MAIDGHTGPILKSDHQLAHWAHSYTFRYQNICYENFNGHTIERDSTLKGDEKMKKDKKYCIDVLSLVIFFVQTKNKNRFFGEKSR